MVCCHLSSHRRNVTSPLLLPLVGLEGSYYAAATFWREISAERLYIATHDIKILNFSVGG
jgi:hypothetical protein